MWRHVLPNSMTPVVTFLPFRMSAAILALTSLDFLGLGVPPGTPSLGELLSQGKNNIDAWWISLSTFARAGAHAAAADLHGRCAARCAGSAEGRQMNRLCWTSRTCAWPSSGKEVVHGIDFTSSPAKSSRWWVSPARARR
jgi:hypothetical protein